MNVECLKTNFILSWLLLYETSIIILDLLFKKIHLHLISSWIPLSFKFVIVYLKNKILLLYVCKFSSFQHFL